MSLGFATNLSHLLHSPSQYGWNWDRLVTGNSGFLTAREIKSVTSAPGVDATAVGTTAVDVTVEGKPTTAIIMSPPQGQTELVPVLTGRNPSAAGEILLGEKTLWQIHKRIGDTVKVQVVGAGPPLLGGKLRIVGTGVLPLLTDTGGLGTGAVLNVSSMPLVLTGSVSSPNTIMLHMGPGPSRAERLGALEKRFPELFFQPFALPSDVANFGGVRNLPYMMAGLLGALALLLMIHTLVSSIKRRGRDLAILKTIGFAPGQLRATVAWQASVLTIVSLLIGLPLGVIGARWAWRLFATNLGVLPETISPILSVGILVPAALVVANLIAAVPGGSAARVRPAQILRAE
jgi:hypothetical protein